MHEFRQGPFRVRDAVADGRSRASVDSRYFEMPFHGIRSPLGVESDLEARCRAYRLRMRADAAFCATTAAVLWGFPLPTYVDLARLEVSVPYGMPRPRSRGVRGSERAPATPTVERRGLRVLDPASTWASLSTRLDVPDLVAVGDFLLSTVRGVSMAAPEELAAAIVSRSPGSPRLRSSLPLLRDRSLSRPESVLRVLVTAAGLPEPELNHPIADVGAMIDIAWPAALFGIEYQGDHHRDPRQFGADVRRQERIHDVGWLLMGVTRYDLFDAPLELVARARARLSERGVRSRVIHPPKWALPRR